MITQRRVEIKTVFNQIGKTKKITINNTKINIATRAIKTFHKKGTVCCCCGLPATHFTIDTDNSTQPPFLSLRGANNKLFTRDHIKPTIEGGSNKYTNMQTMCKECNGVKGSFGKGASTYLTLKNISKGKKNHLRKVLNIPESTLTSEGIYSKGLGLRKIGIASQTLNMDVEEFLQRGKIDRLSREIATNYKIEDIVTIIPMLDFERTLQLRKLRKIQGSV